jgi:probable FeS assembly SUF system protein SufT
MSLANKERTLSRDCEAVMIPSGDPVTLPQGARVYITQTLGGSFTVNAEFGLVRIAGENADALGEEAQVAATRLEANMAIDEALVLEQLKQCYDPEIPVNIVDLGLVYGCEIKQDEQGRYRIDVQMTLTAPGCGMGPAIAADARGKIMALPNVEDAEVSLVWDPPWNQEMISEEGKMKLGMI